MKYKKKYTKSVEKRSAATNRRQGDKGQQYEKERRAKSLPEMIFFSTSGYMCL